LDAYIVAVAVDICDRAGGQLVDESAVFFLNIGTSGTASTAFTVAAASIAGLCVSANLPMAAKISIMGIGQVLQLGFEGTIS